MSTFLGKFEGKCFHLRMILFGIVGLLLISYALWVRNEKQQDLIYVIGGLALLIYSWWIGDVIFIILQIIFIISSALELIKISRRG